MEFIAIVPATDLSNDRFLPRSQPLRGLLTTTLNLKA